MPIVTILSIYTIIDICIYPSLSVVPGENAVGIIWITIVSWVFMIKVGIYLLDTKIRRNQEAIWLRLCLIPPPEKRHEKRCHEQRNSDT
jgi:hypothetical protein